MKRSLIILLSFGLFLGLWYDCTLIRHIGEFAHRSLAVHYTINYLLSGLVLLPTLFLIHKRRDILTSIGFSGSFMRAALFAIVCTLPMFIGYSIVGHSADISVNHMICRILIAGFFEELIFRGFAFGQLFRYAGWGFLPAALLTAVAFGSLHLYQGHDAASALAAFGVTAAGSIFFSWMYVEWNYNLWCPIWLHTLMNAPWLLFSVSDSGAVGGIVVNVLRACTVGLAIGLTILYKRRNGLPYRITLKNLLINKSE